MNDICGRGLPDRLPGLGLEPPVEALGDGGLHQVHVAHHQRHEHLLQVEVEPPATQRSCRGAGPGDTTANQTSRGGTGAADTSTSNKVLVVLEVVIYS